MPVILPANALLYYPDYLAQGCGKCKERKQLAASGRLFRHPSMPYLLFLKKEKGQDPGGDTQNRRRQGVLVRRYGICAFGDYGVQVYDITHENLKKSAAQPQEDVNTAEGGAGWKSGEEQELS
jgi:hypothetical protein